MYEKKQNILIKGTRDGLTLFIDDACSFEEAITELRDKLSSSKNNKDDPMVPVAVKLGNRYLHKNQKDQLLSIIEEENNFTLHSYESNLIEKEEALEWLANDEIKSINRIVRSGQVLEVTGNLLLIGDVNPGGKVVATGNIYIMGRLYGIAHAGSDGDKQSVIAASYMKPNQLRIAHYISRAPDYESDGVYMECGFIDEDEDKIMIDRLQVLSRKRQSLSGFERRMLNG
ncbi:MAG TPA: septum site-determining protein MinC [Candidatus Avamphibacillus sp.]|nr:septum site-determining protein MinC [Candidatus Avamphibacillus sp.]